MSPGQRLCGPLPLVVAALTAGCLPRVPVPLEAWNRTTVPILLVDQDGRRLAVPACGHAGPLAMSLLRVDIQTARGFVSGFGTDAAAPQFLVVVAAPGGSELSEIRPQELPGCRGEPVAQPSG